jgi:hypothetical protein
MQMQLARPKTTRTYKRRVSRAIEPPVFHYLACVNCRDEGKNQCAYRLPISLLTKPLAEIPEERLAPYFSLPPRAIIRLSTLLPTPSYFLPLFIHLFIYFLPFFPLLFPSSILSSSRPRSLHFDRASFSSSSSSLQYYNTFLANFQSPDHIIHSPPSPMNFAKSLYNPEYTSIIIYLIVYYTLNEQFYLYT